jgi:hypothetical protein
MTWDSTYILLVWFYAMRCLTRSNAGHSISNNNKEAKFSTIFCSSIFFVHLPLTSAVESFFHQTYMTHAHTSYNSSYVA